MTEWPRMCSAPGESRHHTPKCHFACIKLTSIAQSNVCAGIVYQDLKPGNVLISGDGNAMLDPEFGVIRQVLQIITSQERMTAPRTACE